jgi:hypothetical protein
MGSPPGKSHENPSWDFHGSIQKSGDLPATFDGGTEEIWKNWGLDGMNDPLPSGKHTIFN